jgi:aryl-alcohol dehydrogenase-like predicted oxidoreductase
MNYRSASRLRASISEIGLGCWQLGADSWGDLPEPAAMQILQTAIDSGVNFLDTADVYGAGRSEEIIGKFLATLPDRGASIFVATKLGRLYGYPDKYTYPIFRECALRSCERLGRACVDLMQLHCVPTERLREGHVFEWMRELKHEKLIRRFGASVESMEEAILCLEHDDLDALQIIFNIFRQKPIDELFAKAREKGVALIVRLPLASGLLAGHFTAHTSFPAGDHRNFNRNGEKFNVGETFAGLPFEQGVAAADRLKPLVPPELSMAEWALRWILDYDAVTTVIPGATRPTQAQSNARPSDLPPLGEDIHRQLADIYHGEIRQHIRGPY